jgi:hypothetical protein
MPCGVVRGLGLASACLESSHTRFAPAPTSSLHPNMPFPSLTSSVRAALFFASFARSGALLYDVLKAAGITDEVLDANKLEHVQFLGLEGYEVSIDSDKGFGRRTDTMLVYEMNGQPLPRDHGYPIRMVVPGYTGARNVKWLSQVTVTRHEVVSPYQTGVQYKALPPNVGSYAQASKELIAATPTCMEVPIISAIATPFNNSSVARTVAVTTGVRCQGYAWCGGGRGVQVPRLVCMLYSMCVCVCVCVCLSQPMMVTLILC